MAVLSLIPALLIPDITEGALHLRKQVAADIPIARLYDFLTTGPLRMADIVGISIGGHLAQMWPPGWPPYLAHHAKMSMIFIPFWFLVGVPFLELFCFLRRRRLRAGSESRA